MTADPKLVAELDVLQRRLLEHSMSTTDEREKVAEALEPCPFCGGEAGFEAGDPNQAICVNADCQATGPWAHSHEHAINLWNEREPALLRSASTGEPAGEVPGHTDLMVTPESLDDWLEDNPLPAGEVRKASEEVAALSDEEKLSRMKAAVEARQASGDAAPGWSPSAPDRVAGEPDERVGSKLLDAAREAAEIAKGEKPAGAVWMNGHRYVPAALLQEAERERDEARDQLARKDEEIERLVADKARLDFLDECNARLNAQTGSSYGWKMVMNHNVNRLMTGRHLDVDLNDAIAYGAKSCREAIDREMDRVASARALLGKQEASDA